VVYTAEREGGDDRYRRYRFAVVARYTNRTSAPVYLDRCGPDGRTPRYGVGLAGGRPGRSAYHPQWGCRGGGAQLEVGPGASRVDTLRLAGPNSFSSAGLGLGEVAGPMRLWYPVHACRDELGCLLPDSLGRSNTFEVRVAPGAGPEARPDA
jgi:hypothetical protein